MCGCLSGLWVGISVITLAEVLELFMDISRFIFTKHGPYSQGKKFSKDPQSQQNCRTCRTYGQMNGSIPLTAVDHDPFNMV